jgi:Na+-translocating ferredoxin:NAD+ oxidoreductase RnfD subunit
VGQGAPGHAFVIICFEMDLCKATGPGPIKSLAKSSVIFFPICFFYEMSFSPICRAQVVDSCKILLLHFGNVVVPTQKRNILRPVQIVCLKPHQFPITLLISAGVCMADFRGALDEKISSSRLVDTATSTHV